MPRRRKKTENENWRFFIDICSELVADSLSNKTLAS
jgi:hypothetical protein